MQKRLHNTKLTKEGRKTVDPKSVLNPRLHVFKVPHHVQPQCTLYSTYTPIDHEPVRLDDTDTHNTRTKAPSKRSGSHGIRHASIAAFARTQDPLLNTTSLTRTQTSAVVRIRTTLHSSSPVLKPLDIGNAASQLAILPFLFSLPTNTVRGREICGVVCYLSAILSLAGGQCQTRFVRAVPTDVVSYL